MIFGQKTRDLNLIPELKSFSSYNFQRAALVGCLQMNKSKMEWDSAEAWN